jgi:hypothetical protein
MTEGRLSSEELGSLVERLWIWANAADEGERISAAYVTGKIDAHQTSLMGDDLREAAKALATLQRSADEMREALSWVGEVYPATSPESGGAIVHMTWEQFNAMRAQVGLKPVKGLSIRAALKALPPQQQAAQARDGERT